MLEETVNCVSYKSPQELLLYLAHRLVARTMESFEPLWRGIDETLQVDSGMFQIVV
jgi:hypothetical protein